MTAYKRLSPYKCAERILSIKKPLIVMHARPDGDTVGSGAALCKIFEALGKTAYYVCEDNIPKRLEFLTEGCKKATSFEGFEPIAVDIASPAQAGNVFNYIPRPILMIDHHEFGEPFADGYIAKGLSSAGEAVLNICEQLIKMNKIKLTPEIAYPIYAAISSDTACFRYSSATRKTYMKAGRLIDVGIDFSDINHRLFNSKLPEQVKAEGYISSNIHTDEGGKIAYASITRRDREELGIPFEYFETAVDVVKQLLGVEVAFVVKETDSNEFRASLRSTGQNVAKIAKELGGGGHVRAAGCSPKAETIEDAVRMVLSLVKKEHFGQA